MKWVETLAYRISRYNRNRKWHLFERAFDFDERTTVLDIGFDDEEFSDVENYFEKRYPFPWNITALGIQQSTKFRERYPQVRTVTYDGGDFPFPDKCFDIGWSNAVLEHVGDFERQVLFVREVVRVSRACFLTTPNRLFPVEVHTRVPLLHYLPARWRDVGYRRLRKEWATGDFMRLLTKRDLQRVLAAAGVASYTLVPNRIGPFALDFVVIAPGATSLRRRR